MKFKDLPYEITSPVSGETLDLQWGKHILEECIDGTEFINSVGVYFKKEGQETIYISCDYEEGDEFDTEKEVKAQHIYESAGGEPGGTEPVYAGDGLWAYPNGELKEL